MPTPSSQGGPSGRSSKITSRRRPAPAAVPEESVRSRGTRGRGARFSPPVDDGLERLQKVLAAAGLGSRRSCEELITSGRVEVDRKVVAELGSRVDPLRQEIRVDGERLPDPRRVVYMLYKPVGVVTTNYDPSGRPRVVDLVPGDQRLFAIGRLDRMSEGLIFVTNDGELANLLAHPRYGVEKKYLVQVAGVPTPETIEKLRKGIKLAEGTARAQHVHLKSQHKQSAVLEMVLDEGKNREIRRMLAQLGHKVHQLKRVAVGKLSLGSLLPGQHRQLAWSEVDALRKDAINHVGAAMDTGPRPRHDDRRGGPRRPPQRGDARTGGPRGVPAGGLRGKKSFGRRPAAHDQRESGDREGRPTRPPTRPPAGAPRRRRKPGKASTWRKPRGE
ncbi:MAG: pseudouridine synthase [Planctomycetota bacterium]